jgi:FkbM family methyltransferase
MNSAPSLQALFRHYLKRVRGFGSRLWRQPRLIPSKLGLVGARIAGTSPNGNGLLRLNRKYVLGNRGSVIELPVDKVIFRSVRFEGQYSPEISQFLSEGLDNSAVAGRKSALLDIGAQAGLITRQAMSLAKSPHEYFLFEPIPAHLEAISRNFADSPANTPVHIEPFGFGKKNGKALFYTEAVNFGNSSLFQGAMLLPEHGIETEVELVEPKVYFDNFGSEFASFAIKSDTQGMDAFILSRIPRRIWERVERAAIEVWAFPEVAREDVERLISLWGAFEYISWEPTLKARIDLTEIADFWTSKSGSERNLFLSRTP